MVAHYRIVEEAGHGTFAAVFRAHDTVLDRPVALKVFKASSVPSSQTVLAEARAAAALNHPNVCTIHAFERTGDALCDEDEREPSDDHEPPTSDGQASKFLHTALRGRYQHGRLAGCMIDAEYAI